MTGSNEERLAVTWIAKKSTADNCICEGCFGKGRVTKITVPKTHYHGGRSLKTEYRQVWLCDECAQALKNALQEAEENAPLTIEQLRGMNGEPVWWWNKSQKPTCMICVYDKFGKFNTEPVFVNFDFAAEDAAKITSYSRMKKWGYKPYRRKPHSPQKTED
jgi:hypothetical protein